MLSDNINNLKIWLNDNNISFSENYDLKNTSWIKAGGIIKTFITPDTEEKAIIIVKYFFENNIKFYVLGNLSNVLIRDGDILTPIINLNKLSTIKQISKNGLNFSVQAGTPISRFAIFFTKKNIYGVQGLVGIPGNIGGGIYMNSSSYNSCISDYLDNITVISKDGKLETLNKSEANFAWRYSIFHLEPKVILKAEFHFPKECLNHNTNLNNMLTKIKNHRNTFQEKKYPNLGSTFATRNIYKDISKVSFIYFILYLLNKVFSLIFSKMATDTFLNYRKTVIKIYSLFLKIDKQNRYGFSDRTLNCIVNYGSTSSNDAITIIRNLQNKFKKTNRLENIILDDIK